MKFFCSRIVAAPLTAAVAFFIISQILAMQNLFVIMDGSKLILHKTYENNVQYALQEAGISIQNTDYVSFPHANASGGFSEVVIKRSSYVTIEADGKKIRLTTFGESVASLLDFAKINLRMTDQVTPDLGTPTKDGMNIVVTRFETRLDRTEESMPFEVVRKPQRRLAQGEERVAQEGTPGTIEHVYQVTLRNGQPTERNLLSSTVTVQPLPKIIEYGTGGTITIGGKTHRYSRVLEVTATAYTTEGYTIKHTRMGTVARVGAIAVDPKVIPLGSKVYIEGPNGKWVYGVATCEDTGGFIKGNRIDLFYDTRAECWAFGRRKATLYVLE